MDVIVGKLYTSIPQSRKRDKNVEDEVEQKHQTKDAGTFTKHLVKGGDYAKLISNISGMRMEFLQHSSPLDDNGRRLFTKPNLDRFRARLEERRTAHEELLEKVLSDWYSIVDAQRDRLQDLFNPADYPSADTIRNKFVISFDEFPFMREDSEIFNEMSSEFSEEIDRMREGVKKERSAAAASCVRDCLERLHTSLKYASERLSDVDAQFKRNTIENIIETVNQIESLNWVEDPEIERLKESARSIVVDAGDDVPGFCEFLRKSKGFRQTVVGNIDATVAEINTRLADYD